MAGTLAQLMSQRARPAEWVVRDYMMADPKARHMPKMTITTGPPPDSLHPQEQKRVLPASWSRQPSTHCLNSAT